MNDRFPKFLNKNLLWDKYVVIDQIEEIGFRDGKILYHLCNNNEDIKM